MTSVPFKYGWKHGVAIIPKESEMIVIIEDIYDQIIRHNVVKDNSISVEWLWKLPWKDFFFSYLDDKQYFYDDSNVLQELWYSSAR